MTLTILKSKIHRAVVTQADLDYVGSVTIDATLMALSGIVEYEKVLIADLTNGNRLETYVIAGEAGSGVICMNGAAARCVEVGDKVIIMAFAGMSPEEAAKHSPKVVFVDDRNRAVKTTDCEKHSWNIGGGKNGSQC